MSVLAAHQPNYLPWTGYFHKMARADVFVFVDAVQMPYGATYGFANRNRIKTQSGARWLTVPLRRKGSICYLEAETAGADWCKEHLRVVRQHYARAAHFDEVYPGYARILGLSLSFVETNLALIRFFAGLLGLRPAFHRQSELDVEGPGSELHVKLCQALGCDAYLSGSGARDYDDPTLFEAAGIELRYDEFEPPIYPQLYGSFVPGLSVIDMLMNVGSFKAVSLLQE